MLSKQGLPIELYLEIASHFKYAGHINSLMQTSRRLYDLLNRVLYRFAIRIDYGVELLIWAIKHGRIRVAHKVLDEGVLSRAKYPGAWKMMCSAVQNRDAAMVDLLQKDGIESLINVRRKE